MPLRRWGVLVIFALFAAMGQSVPALGQPVSDGDPAPSPSGGPPPAVQPVLPIPVQAPEDKRIFGVLPNNRTTEESIPFHSITAKAEGHDCV